VAALPSKSLDPAARGSADSASAAQLSSLRRQLGYNRKFRPGRNHVVLIAIIVIGAWVVVGFGRTITSMNAALDRQSALTAENQALSAQLTAGERELILVQTDEFQALQARAFGIGRPGEIAFSLETDAPAAPPVVPLGSTGTDSQANAPLEDWLKLLFGD
jgi:cell division protein FtsB